MAYNDHTLYYLEIMCYFESSTHSHAIWTKNCVIFQLTVNTMCDLWVIAGQKNAFIAIFQLHSIVLLSLK